MGPGYSPVQGRVAVADNGSVFVAVHDEQNGGSIFLSRSFDRGHTFWGDVQVDLASTDPDWLNQSGPADVATSNGRVYVVYCSQRNHQVPPWVSDYYHVFLRYSDDGGLSFGSIIQVDDNPWANSAPGCGPFDGLWLAAFGNDVYVLWRDGRWGGNWHASFARSTDGGNTFGPNLRVDDVIDLNTEIYIWGMAVDGDGTIYVPWIASGQDRMSISRDFGSSFDPSQVVDRHQYDPIGTGWTGVVAFSGNVYLTWSSDPGDGSWENVYVSRSPDGGTTFSFPIRVDDAGMGSTNQSAPAIAVDGRGTIYVGWADDRMGHSYFARSGDGGATFGPSRPLVDPNFSMWQQGGAQPATNSAGFTVFLWSDWRFDHDEGDLYAAVLPADVLSDLTIAPSDLAISPSAPYTPGTAVNFSATVRNVGNANVSTVAVRFTDGVLPAGTPLGPDQSVPLLTRRGGTATLELTWTASAPGPHELCATADPDDAINETDESNNGACVIVEVLPNLVPPLFTAVDVTGPDVQLAWTPSSTVGVDRYEVFAGDSPTSLDFTAPVGWTPGSTAWTEAFGAAGRTERYYAVRGVNTTYGLESGTGDTAGFFLRAFDAGENDFGLPLDPFQPGNLSSYAAAIGASAVQWMNAGNWVTVAGASTDHPATLGEGYQIVLPSPTTYAFTGLPATQVRYRGGPGFDTATRTSLTAMVTGTNTELQWSAAPGASLYRVYRSSSRSGFFTAAAILLDSTANTSLLDPGAAASDGAWYYLVAPVDGTGTEGASTYSVGVWTTTFAGTAAMALPLRPFSPLSVSEFTATVPNALGVLWRSGGRWVPHFASMPPGVYDTVMGLGGGYQISVSVAGRYTFVGR